MHKLEIPEWVVQRVRALRGKAHAFSDLDPRRTALLVIDLQNSFMMDGVAHSPSPVAREIVPNVNRIADTVRKAGGMVVWVKNTATEEARESWSVFHNELASDEKRKKYKEGMSEGTLGHQLWAELDVQPEDESVNKTRFSAFIQGSSNLEALLRGRGIDTVIVTGTSTGVCCESTARDAMMLNFKTIMITDANAAKDDDEHNAALTAFYRNFGDIMSTNDVIGYLLTNSAQPRLAVEKG